MDVTGTPPFRCGNHHRSMGRPYSRLAKSAAILLLSFSAAVDAISPVRAVVPMPVISRNVPAYASSVGGGNTPDNANNAIYDDLNYHLWQSAGTPAWITYDLSGVPASQRGLVDVTWFNNSDAYDPTIGAGGSMMGVPTNYTIQANAAPGGTGAAPPSGWVTLASVTGNKYHSRQQVVNLAGYNWVRMDVTAVTGGSDVQLMHLDVQDLSQSGGVPQDSWIFYGDSITLGATNYAEVYDGSPDNFTFASLINAKMPQNFPAQEDGGTVGAGVADAVANIDTWLPLFPGRFVDISYGTNDAGGMSPTDFYNNYALIVQKVINAGKVPIVPKIPWGKTSTVQAYVPALNTMIDQLYANFPQIVRGPDFWTFFQNNQALIGSGDVHPTSDGYGQMRQLWATTMLQNVYGTGVQPPASIVVSPASVPFGSVNTGARATAPVTFSNPGGSALTVTGATLPAAPFTVTGLPATGSTLAPGQSVNSTITFAPTAAGSFSARLTLATSAGSAVVSLSGTGTAPTPAQITANPTSVNFGSMTMGTSTSSSITLSNTGGSPLTVNSAAMPAAPFTATGVPAPGTALAPGQAVSVTLTFAPSGSGTYNSPLTVVTSAGSATVMLSGTAVSPAPANLAANPSSVSLGSVVVGASMSQTIKFSNTGGLPLTLQASTLPTAPFKVTGVPAAGAVLNGGQSFSATVVFSPTTAGSFNGQLTVVSSVGTLSVPLSGTGILASGSSIGDPALGGWKINGSATLLGSTPGSQLQLTPAATSEAGTAFWPTPVSSANLTASFDLTIDGGDPSYGADGVALVLADPASGASPTAVGGNGGGLGCAGIPGFCVGFETYPRSMAGIADNGTDPTADWLSYLRQTSTGVPSLRSSTHRVQITILNGLVTVTIGSTKVISKTIALPSHVLVGFSGSTGPYLYDRHAISNVVFTVH